ncbi:MAG TPA: glycosyltransferase, partial [Aliiroseovarius sp.]|nr:glycosyltransferase [Aliiroseovarius sp.]
ALRTQPAPGLTFHGWLAHEQVQDVLANATPMALPSVREFGGGVVLEAMALGVPPLVVDYAGPGELVGDGLGFKIPLDDRAGIIRALRGELRRLAQAPDLLAETGARARAHVEAHFTWAAKARQIARVYDWVTQGGPRPTLLHAQPPAQRPPKAGAPAPKRP